MIRKIIERAKQNPKRIVFPEGIDERTLQAVEIITKEGIADALLLGKEKEIKDKAASLGVDISKAKILDPLLDPERENVVDVFYNLRKAKLVNRDEASAILEDSTFYAAMLVKLGKYDGYIGGVLRTTADTIRPALQIIKTRQGIKYCSGAMLLEFPDRDFLFADVSVIPRPDSEALAEIASMSAETAKLFGIEPKIAMLSFSTKGSSSTPEVDVVKKAAELAKMRGLDVDGELQLDAALSEDVARRKCPGSSVGGKANVLIFPNLDAGNIGYKLVERLAHCKAFGPIFQGLAKPVNGLSRGCSVDDIVGVVAITVVQAQQEELR